MRSELQAGDTLRLERARAVVTVDRRLGAGGQGVVHRAMLNGAPFAVKWYGDNNHAGDLRESVNMLVRRGRAPHPSFVWPIDVVVSDRIPGYGYLMRLIEPRFVTLAQMLNAPEQPSFRVIATLGRELVDAFAALHAAGLCYRDISFGNVRVDPIAAEVAVIDIDNIGTDGDEVFVRGTPPFMAPEIVRGEALPTSITDLHSLAVLLFWLFVRGHPLLGSRTDSTYNWDHNRHVSEAELLVRNFGHDPLFVFHPHNQLNRPLPGDPMTMWWNIYPRFLRDLFITAFTTGLTDPSLHGRVTEGTWRRALLLLHDSVATCASCGAAVFYDPQRAGTCWDCRAATPTPPLLETPGGTVVLSEGAVVSMRHLYRSRDHQSVLAQVESHPGRAGQVVLRNMSGQPWVVHPDGEEPRTVAPAQRVAIRPMTIDFQNCRGRIIQPPVPKDGRA